MKNGKPNSHGTWRTTTGAHVAGCRRRGALPRDMSACWRPETCRERGRCCLRTIPLHAMSLSSCSCSHSLPHLQWLDSREGEAGLLLLLSQDVSHTEVASAHLHGERATGEGCGRVEFGTRGGVACKDLGCAEIRLIVQETKQQESWKRGRRLDWGGGLQLTWSPGRGEPGDGVG